MTAAGSTLRGACRTLFGRWCDGNRHLNKPQSEDEKKETARAQEKFAESVRNVRKLWDAGILLAAGTDAPYPGMYQGEGLHHELELMGRAGLTPLQAIQAATYNTARIMKAENAWGSLRKGFRATLILVNGKPDRNISDTRQFEAVIQDGRVLDRSSLKFDAKRDPEYRAVASVSLGASTFLRTQEMKSTPSIISMVKNQRP